MIKSRDQATRLPSSTSQKGKEPLNDSRSAVLTFRVVPVLIRPRWRISRLNLPKSVSPWQGQRREGKSLYEQMPESKPTVPLPPPHLRIDVVVDNEVRVDSRRNLLFDAPRGRHVPAPLRLKTSQLLSTSVLTFILIG